MVLVTGATGLVGSHLVLHLLENGENVRAMYRNIETTEKTKALFKMFDKENLFDKIEWIQADIIDIPSLAKAFANIEKVYHCAAMISFEPKDEVQLRKVNIEGTANVVNFCLDFKVKKLCYVSSIAALGDLKDHETIITETTEWNPEKEHSDYAISKFGAEIEVFRGQQEGLETVIVNPGVILGQVPNLKDFTSGSSAIYAKVKKGLFFYTKGSTSFVSVNDVVKFMRFLMNSDISNERYILSAGDFTFKDIITYIAKSLGLKPPTVYVRPFIIEMVWRIDWLISNILFKERTLSKAMAKSLNAEESLSNKKLKEALHYDFENIEAYCATIGKNLKG